MATHIVIAPATASAANTTNAINTDGYTSVVVSAPGLAGAEEVDIYIKTAGGYAIYGITGTAYKLTSTIQAIQLPAGPVYAFAKDATAGAAGVYVDLGSVQG